jgi:cephalosporin hydroxylase
MNEFEKEVTDRLAANGENLALKASASEFMRLSTEPKYSYNFSWLGRPIIQYPQDVVAMQELIWSVKPDLIIETGIAHGGSLILSASLLAMIDMAEAVEQGLQMDPAVSRRKVLGIDIDIRPHNRAAIEAHPMYSRIEMIEGSSIDAEVIGRVRDFASNYSKVMVCLDSNHTHDHVLAELEAYATLTSFDSYCVVFDTIVDDLAAEMFPYRPWGPGNNPKTAVKAYLEKNDEFEVDKSVDNKLLISVASQGYLKRIR